MKEKLLALVFLLTTAACSASLPDLPDGWSDNYVYANGIRIHYYRAVPASGKPVIVAVHGVMDTGLAWASVATKLQAEYDIYMLDTRGHGFSDPFTNTEDGMTLIKDVVAAVEALGLKKPILMGHSMGAATVMRLGAEYPEFARAIIMLDPGLASRGPREASAPRPERPATQAPRESAAPAKMSIAMRGSPESLVAQNNYSYDDLIAKAHRDNPRWSMMDCRYWAHAIKRYHGPYSDAVWQAMSGTMRTEDALAKIQVPAIILKADAPAEARQAHQEAARVMQKGKLVHIDDSAHNLQRDQPGRAADVIREFLSEL